ncbi:MULTISPECIES: ATPase [unclassified Roseibium]|uniref:ATPase n=1 Tax=unclassified Roseibium TaxID=2629323 RepID=UPI00273FB8E4|nr:MULTISPECIES: ATPase [unclassified Roseibium]
MNITWKKTWPDRDNDGTAQCDSLPDISARVYLENGGRHWYWFVNGKAAISRGQEDTKAAAKSAVEMEFERLLNADDY